MASAPSPLSSTVNSVFEAFIKKLGDEKALEPTALNALKESLLLSEDQVFCAKSSLSWKSTQEGGWSCSASLPLLRRLREVEPWPRETISRPTSAVSR